VVPMQGINDDELIEIAGLSFSYPFHIRFIEYMPMGTAQIERDRQLLADEVKKRIHKLGKLTPVEKKINDGPAERYKFEGAVGEIGFIRPISRHFCNTCNRLRLTASGQLRPCLLSDYREDIKGPLRKGCSDSELAEVFLNAVRSKPSEHSLAGDHTNGFSGQMCAIGG
jgi:cyclic pyranopterin phosphate synthase